MAAQFACNLGSLNLYEFVENPFTKDASFNWGDFESSVRIGVRALDTIIDENVERLPDELLSYKENSLNYRNIGLGVFGYADMLMALGLTYGSKEAIEFSKKLFQDMFIVAVYASANLAKERGAFPKHMVSVLNSEIFRKHFNRSYDFHNNQNFVRYGLRNCSLLSIAPTGTISSLLGRSGGLEPQFSLSYTRRTDNLKESYKIDAAVVKDFMRITGKEELPEYFVTSQEVHWSDRIDTQAAIQESIDTAISSTINLPKETTKDDIELLYLYAWERGLKGVTVFRDGCKKLGILLHNDSDGEEEEEPKNILELKRGEIKPISNDLVGLKRTLVTGCGTLHCQAFFDPNTADLQEIYLSKGSTGGCVSGNTEYFNGYTWKSISQYVEGEKVLQYNLDGSANLVSPINYIVNKDVKTLIQFQNKFLTMQLSKDHRMFLYKNFRHYQSKRDISLTSEIITVENYLENIKERHIPTTFTYESNGIPLTDNEIKLCVAFYADGTICNKNSNYCSIMVSKNRKKERIEELLKINNIDYKIFDYESTHEKGYLTFKFYVDIDTILGEYLLKKQFTSHWYDASLSQRKIILNELQYWDGHKEEGNRGYCFTSKKQEEIDFVQFIATSCGYRANISSIKNAKRVRYNDNLTVLNINKMSITEIPTLDNKSYCFTVPSGLLILRFNGKIFITGNCNNFMIGLSRMISLAARCGASLDSIIDQLNSCGACASYATRAAVKKDTSKGSCCPIAVGFALREMHDEFVKYYLENGLEVKEESCPKKEKIVKKIIDEVKDHGVKCPTCGETLLFEGGCNICKSCGWSRCE